MSSMGTLKAVVQGGRVVVEESVDYPDGTVLELDVAEPMDDEERAKLDAAIDSAWKRHKAGGKTIPADQVIAKLRAKE